MKNQMVMENLIDFRDSSSKLYPAKLFGVIKHKCIAIDVTGTDENNSEILQPGYLIQLITDYRGDGCHFKMRNFTNWLDKYKTTVYMCSKDDFITVTMDLWPYLVACKSYENRIKFVENVYSHKFDVNLLKLGCELKIRRPLGDKVKYYEFIVIHNGIVKEIGPGHYIGIQLKNNYVLGFDLTYFTRYYRFGGNGIIVSADWIMENLYNEERFNESTNNVVYSTNVKMNPNKWIDLCNSVNGPRDKHGNNSNERNLLMLESVSKELSAEPVCPSIAIIEPMKIRETGSISIQHCGPCEMSTKIKPKNHITRLEWFNNLAGSVEDVGITKCDLCAAFVEIGRGVILRECVHSFCKRCIRLHVEPCDKEYKCQFNMLDDEIKDIGGISADNSFVYNKLKDYLFNAKFDATVSLRNPRYAHPNFSKQVADPIHMVKNFTDCKYFVEDSMSFDDVKANTLPPISRAAVSTFDRTVSQKLMEDQLECDKTDHDFKTTFFCIICQKVFEPPGMNIPICVSCYGTLADEDIT